jgi:hypothetical protein
VHANQHVVLAVDGALDHRDVVLLVDHRAEADHGEIAELGGQLRLGHALDELVVPAPVRDQVGDRDHLQPVARAVALEVRNARHRAVVVHHLADDAARVEPGEPREVDGRLGLPGALQHAAGLGLEREDVAGLHEVLRPGRRVDRHLDGAGAVVRGDAGADPLACLDGDGERGLEGRLVLGRHQVEAELVAAVGRQGEADQPATVGRHEVDRLGRGELCRQREVALVLAVLGVADDDHASGADVLERLLDRAEGAHACSFSRYLASTSTSKFTVRPGAADPNVVRSKVSGISETSNATASTALTVRDTPSTAIDPFSTM